MKKDDFQSRFTLKESRITQTLMARMKVKLIKRLEHEFNTLP